MIFGNKSEYAIEVYHKPLDNSSFYMTGRMCIHLFDKSFGRIYEEDCALAVYYMTLVDKINNINILKNDFNLDNDYSVFEYLDDKLYVGSIERTMEQIHNYYDLYGKFDFMTGTGETFDDSKSFIYLDKNEIVHIIYQKSIYNYDTKIFKDEDIICNEIDKEIFIKVTKEFIKWYEETEKMKLIK